MMAMDHSKLLAVYDELSTFLAQINVTKERVCVSPTSRLHYYRCIRESHGHELQVSCIYIIIEYKLINACYFLEKPIFIWKGLP